MYGECNQVMTDPAVKQVLAEYQQRIQAEDSLRKKLSRQEWLARRDEFLLEVGEAAATLLNILIREAQAKTILEIGTSYGYSTVWLSEAARATQGKVITLDRNAQKQDYARNMIAKASLADFVEFRCGDAIQLIGQMSETVDLVLIDLWKNLYIPCFDAVLPKLSSGAILVADNMLFPPDNRSVAAEYRAHIRRREAIDSVLLPVGHGIEISRWRTPD
jgi:predicted O-methyltransferase YrrM